MHTLGILIDADVLWYRGIKHFRRYNYIAYFFPMVHFMSNVTILFDFV